MLCDLRGFTSTASDMAPELVAGMLNEYYDFITGAIFEADPDWAFRYWAGFCGPLTSASTCTFTMFGNVETSPVFRCTGETCSSSDPIVREVKTKVRVGAPAT